MAKVTSKLQLTVPKAIADQYGIRPGDDLKWEPAGDVITIVPKNRRRRLSVKERLRILDEMWHRIDARAKQHPVKRANPGEDRGWTREDLYEPPRGLPR